MQEKRLNEAESLELITAMIHNARTNLRARINCTILLVWGYTITFISLLLYIVKKYELSSYSSLLWFLIPLICYPTTKFLYSRDTTHIKSYLDKIIDYISLLFIIICSVMGLTVIWIYFPILFIEGILFNIWILIIGILIKYKVIIWGGIIGIILSYSLLFVSGEIHQILIFGLISVFSIIIPGHFLKNSISKNVQRA